MLPILNIGPLAIQLPGLILLVGLYSGLLLAERYSTRHKVQSNTLFNLVFWVLLAGIIGARLSYVIRYPAVFVDDPLSIFSLNPTLLDAFGGIALGTIASIYYGQRQNLSLWSTLDALTPVFAVFAIALGIAHLASGDAFGALTDLPWGIELWSAIRHPSQFYETSLAIIILAILWPTHRYIQNLPEGSYFLSFTALSASSRLFLEAFRGDSILLPGGYRLWQIVAWMILACSLFGLNKFFQDKEHDTVSVP